MSYRQARNEFQAVVEQFLAPANPEQAALRRLAQGLDELAKSIQGDLEKIERNT